MKKIDVSILGITGHTGEELLRVLSSHACVELSSVYARLERPLSLGALYPFVKKEWSGIEVKDIEGDIALDVDCIFAALPHTVSMQYISKIKKAGFKGKIIDLSADYRFSDVTTYEQWYSRHIDKGSINESCYGLPELYRAKIKEAALIANPGCYPTATILSLFPLFTVNGLVNEIIVDAKSGASGAGRKLSEQYLFTSLNANMWAYKPNSHQHIPEILEHIALSREKFSFFPHIMGIERGIMVSCYASLNKDITKEDLLSLFQNAYKDEPFVKIIKQPPRLKDVVFTNYVMVCPILLSPKKAVVFGAIDNLTKGASGQAVQNMNIVFGLNEKEGLS